MSGPAASVEAPRASGARALAVPLVAGCLVTVVLGAYAGTHDPTGRALNLGGFGSPAAVKSWLTVVATALLVVQVATAASMWGRFGLATPRWIAPLHRWSGRLALLVLTPVAVHCLYALGFQHDSTRTLAHSLAGCFFFGAVTTKLLALPRPGLPGWALPVLGGLATALLVALTLTSALWFFTLSGTSG